MSEGLMTMNIDSDVLSELAASWDGYAEDAERTHYRLVPVEQAWVEVQR
jgi:hypothetical protein